MSSSVNKVTLIGNLGQDPEVRSMQNGKSMATFSLATTESWKDKSTGERRDKTEWHRIAIFSDGLVRIAQSYLKKGSKIYIEGQLQTRKWQDQDGKDRYSTEVVLQNFNSVLVMLDSRNPNQEAGGYNNDPMQQSQSSFGQVSPSSGNAAPSSSFIQELDDEVPF